jgi:protein-disulfide isomerase
MVFRCEPCNKEFQSAEALNSHNADKHAPSSHEAKEMKRRLVEEQRAKEASGSKKARWKRTLTTYGILLVIFLALVGGATYFFTGPAPPPVSIVEHSKGTGDILVEEFSDFQCPACGAAYPELKRFFEGNASDRVKFVYKHFPLTQIHPQAYKAAEAAECADEQGKFWEYHDKLFENQRSLLRSNLITFAEQIGLDKDKFTSCLDSGRMSGRVQAGIDEGNSRGVRSTPTFFINGQKYEGVLTAEQLEREIGKL